MVGLWRHHVQRTLPGQRERREREPVFSSAVMTDLGNAGVLLEAISWLSRHALGFTILPRRLPYLLAFIAGGVADQSQISVSTGCSIIELFLWHPAVHTSKFCDFHRIWCKNNAFCFVSLSSPRRKLSILSSIVWSLSGIVWLSGPVSWIRLCCKWFFPFSFNALHLLRRRKQCTLEVSFGFYSFTCWLWFGRQSIMLQLFSAAREPVTSYCTVNHASQEAWGFCFWRTWMGVINSVFN